MSHTTWRTKARMVGGRAMGVLGAILLAGIPAPTAAGGVTLAIANRTVVEGDTGTTVVARFAVTLSEAAAGIVTVRFTTQNGSAGAPGDYVARNGTLTFTPGQLTRNIAVTVNGDAVDEVNETFRVRLSEPTGATIVDDLGVGRITDDDGPGISVADAPATPPHAWEWGKGQTTGRVRFTVTLSDPSPQQVRVRATTVALPPGAGHATIGTDLAALDHVVVTFAPNDVSEVVEVTILGDWIDEPNETFQLRLSGPVNATIDDGVAVGTINDDDCTGSDPGPGSATDLGPISGDTGSDVETRSAAIGCNNEVDWYRFDLTEFPFFGSEDLTARITLLVGDTPPQGGGNLDLCLYRTNGTVLVGCSSRTRTADEEIEISRVDGSGDSGIAVWVKVLPRTRGSNAYTLRVEGDLAVSDPIVIP